MLKGFFIGYFIGGFIGAFIISAICITNINILRDKLKWYEDYPKRPLGIKTIIASRGDKE